MGELRFLFALLFVSPSSAVMKVFYLPAVSIALLCGTGSVYALESYHTPNRSLTAIIAQVPRCPVSPENVPEVNSPIDLTQLSCVLANIAANGCDLGDTHCLCNTHSLDEDVADCIYANCTMADALSKF